VEVNAPTFAAAKSIADDVVAALRSHIRGDDARVSSTTQVDTGGGERASIVIRWGAASREQKN
jgi:azurin